MNGKEKKKKMQYDTSVRNGGFSLVELSIVLVILGLLVGGILTGQSLIRAAELRSVTVGFKTYHSSLMTFRDKYFALPGDMTNATDFWGAAAAGGTGSSCFTADVTDSSTCNGNGDGFINRPEGATGVWDFGERFSAWKHLANSGLVEGNYTGKTDHATDPNVMTAGVNVPASKISNGHFSLAMLNASATSIYYNPTASDMNFIGFSKILTPQEAWNIDKKLDDGKPGQGRMTTIDWDNAGGKDCADNGDPELAEYQLDSDTSNACSLIYFY